jgi:hypothetical protein
LDKKKTELHLQKKTLEMEIERYQATIDKVVGYSDGFKTDSNFKPNAINYGGKRWEKPQNMPPVVWFELLQIDLDNYYTELSTQKCSAVNKLNVLDYSIRILQDSVPFELNRQLISHQNTLSKLDIFAKRLSDEESSDDESAILQPKKTRY